MSSTNESFDGKRRALLAAFSEAVAPDGFTLKGYEVIGELDRGGMAVVYHARQLSPEREVALKVMLPKYSGEEDMRLRFQTEARAMAKLEHPGIMPIYEVGESEQLPFFSMKLAESGSLAKRVAQQRPSVKLTVEWMVRIADAVHYAHQRGVLHRDLKPGNFLFDSHDQVYVSDFGVAKMMLGEDMGLTQTEAFVGTPNYMPPELAGGTSKEANVSGDLYALGTVFYECLTGKRPHSEHTNFTALLRAIVDERLPSPRSLVPEIPIDLDVICSKVLEKDPAARYASVSEFRDELIRWQEGRAILARPLSPIARIWRWMKRHPFPVLLLCIIFLGALPYIILQNYSLSQSIHKSLFEQASLESVLAKPGFRERGFALLHQSAAHRKSSEIPNLAISLLSKIDVSETEFHERFLRKPPSFIDSTHLNDWILSADGEWILVHESSGGAALWRTRDETLHQRWEALGGHVVMADFVKNGVLVVGAEQQLKDREDERLQANALIYSGTHFENVAHIEALQDESFLLFEVSPNGEQIAFGGTEGLQVIDVATRSILWSFRDGGVRCPPTWSRDGAHIACALGTDNKVFVYDMSHHRQTVEFPSKYWVKDLAFHPNHRVLAMVRGDGVVSLIDIFENNVVADLSFPVETNGEIHFSDDGKNMWLTGQVPKAWNFHEAVGYREWLRLSVKNRNTTTFQSRFSPNKKWLLTARAEGLKLWNVAEGRQTNFYGSENQRIDDDCAAWWINDHEILLQVPGGLEKIRLSSSGELSFGEKVPRNVGSRVLDVRANGDFLVEEPDEDGGASLWIWLQGDHDRKHHLQDEQWEEMDLSRVSHETEEIHAEVLNDGSIKCSGEIDFVFTPPQDLKVHQILFSEGSNLIAISKEGRVIEWDFDELKAELKSIGL